MSTMVWARGRQSPTLKMVLLAVLVVALVAQPTCEAVERRAPLAKSPPPPVRNADAYKVVVENALLDLRTRWGGNTTWGATWVRGRNCTTWAFTTCNLDGDILSLSLIRRNILGLIPSTFYTITTFTSINLANNRLYGSVRRDLAVINPNLRYLNLSKNFFTGQWPDRWSPPDYDEANYKLYMTIDVSNTFFYGLATITLTSPVLGYSYWCIGDDFPGSWTGSCISYIQAQYSGERAGECPNTESQASLPNEQCFAWCGTNTDTGMCQQGRGQCVPIFSGNTTTVIRKSCLYSPPGPNPPPPPPPPPVDVVPAELSKLLDLRAALGNPAALASWVAGAKCSALARVSCDPTGIIIGLDLSSLRLRGLFPSALLSFTNLISLSVKNNTLHGPVDLTPLAKVLTSIDLSRNYFSGPPPKGFMTLDFYDISNNYFTGDPNIDGYCPLNGAVFQGSNCLTYYINYGCYPQTQRSPEVCAAFCGTIAYPPRAACQNGNAGVCAPTFSTQGVVISARCNGTYTPPPRPKAPTVTGAGLVWAPFADKYKFTGYFSWLDPDATCDKWAGMTCDSNGNVISLNFSGRLFSGRIPTDDVLWSGRSTGNSLRSLDFSRNRLFGRIPDLVAKATHLTHLDLSSNFLSGPLPQAFQGRYQFLNIANNFLFGSPAITGQDNATSFCPGKSVAGGQGNNCFGAGPSGWTCGPLVAKPTADCSSFCGVGTALGMCRNNGSFCSPVFVANRLSTYRCRL